MNLHRPLQWIRITLFLISGSILLIGLQWNVSAVLQMPVGGEILIQTLSMFMLGTIAGRNLHFQSTLVFLGLAGWMVLLIFGNEHSPSQIGRWHAHTLLGGLLVRLHLRSKRARPSSPQERLKI